MNTSPLELVTRASAASGAFDEDAFQHEIGDLALGGGPAGPCHAHIFPRCEASLETSGPGVEQSIDDLSLTITEIEQRTLGGCVTLTAEGASRSVSDTSQVPRN